MHLVAQQGAQPLQDVGSPEPVRPLSLTKSVLWLMLAKTVAFAFTFAVPLLLVRQFTVREFGVYKQLFLLLDTAGVILPLGFAMSAFYFFPREPARKTQVVGNIMLVYVLMGGLGGALVVAFPSLLATVLNSHDLSAYAPAIGIAMLLWVGSSFVEFVAIANGEVRVAALVIPVTVLLRSASLVIAGGLFGSIGALAYAAVVYGLLQCAVMIWYVRSRFSALWQVEWRLMRAQVAYAVPLAYANGLLWWLETSVHHFFVSNRFGAAGYAVYAVGCFQLPIVAIALESVGSVLIRRVNDLRRRNETQEIVRLVAATVRRLAAIALPLYALLLVTGRDVITVLFTQRYLASWPIFAVNLTLIPLSIIAPAYDAVFRAYPEHLSILLTTRTALLAPLLGGLWIATQQPSLVGAIAVVVGVNLVERVVIAVRIAGPLGIGWSDLGLFRDVAKLGVAAGVAGVATGVARRVLLGNGLGGVPLTLLVISATLFIVVYLGAVLLLRVLTPEERGTIRQWLTRVHQVTLWKSATDSPKLGGREPSV